MNGWPFSSFDPCLQWRLGLAFQGLHGLGYQLCVCGLLCSLPGLGARFGEVGAVVTVDRPGPLVFLEYSNFSAMFWG